MGKIVFYRLFNLLRERNIKQKELLENGVVSEGTLSRMRNNGNVTTGNIAPICEYLNCNIEDLCEYRSEKERPQE